MPKNIVICSDGTGNSAIKGRGTNVFKLFEAIDLNGHRTDPTLDPQIALYDDGVGTEDLKPLRVLGGAIGLGLARNVRQLYRELARVYDPGDRIFLFGFSRGAFTARTLVGMIVRCGILNGSDIARLPTTRALHDAVEDTYDAYRKGYASHLTRLVGKVLRWPDRATAISALHEKYPFHPPAPIAFVGVWDTVDAVGTPFALGEFVNTWLYQYKFPTSDLSEKVEHACHALSIDDERKSFTPVLWKELTADAERIEQVWFPGVHSNVGGGYPKQGLSLVALEWMLRRAMDVGGLRVQLHDLETFAGHASADDKLYDPRAGTGIFYRWSPRKIAALCQDNQVRPKVHLSVLERVAHGTEDYAPGNLPLHASVVITPTGRPDQDETARLRAEAVEKVLNQAVTSGGDPLAAVAGHLRLGELSYWIFMASWAVLAVGAVGALVESGGPPTLAGVVKSVFTLVGNVLSLRVGELFETFKVLLASAWGVTLAAAVIGFVVAWRLSARADAGMSEIFSTFWHQRQPALRAALKLARAQARLSTVSHRSTERLVPERPEVRR